MEWRIAEAKQKLSEVIRAAAEEPQLIYNRSRLVAAVIDIETFREYQRWSERRNKPSLAAVSGKLRNLCVEEEYTLDVAPHHAPSAPGKSSSRSGSRSRSGSGAGPSRSS